MECLQVIENKGVFGQVGSRRAATIRDMEMFSFQKSELLCLFSMGYSLGGIFCGGPLAC